jgi:hypothetical protein
LVKNLDWLGRGPKMAYKNNPNKTTRAIITKNLNAIPCAGGATDIVDELWIEFIFKL